jgi:hypothetical protein
VTRSAPWVDRTLAGATYRITFEPRWVPLTLPLEDSRAGFAEPLVVPWHKAGDRLGAATRSGVKEHQEPFSRLAQVLYRTVSVTVAL